MSVDADVLHSKFFLKSKCVGYYQKASNIQLDFFVVNVCYIPFFHFASPHWDKEWRVNAILWSDYLFSCEQGFYL